MKVRRPIVLQMAVDVGRMVTGALGFARDLVWARDSPTAISLLRAHALRARPGVTSTYDVVLVHDRAEERAVVLEVAFCDRPDPRRARALHARFDRRFRLPGREPLPLAVRYDWNGGAEFHVGEERLAPENLTRGGDVRPGKWLVVASLSTPEGRLLERLAVVQHLEPPG